MDLREDPDTRARLSDRMLAPISQEQGEKMAKRMGAVKFVSPSSLLLFAFDDPNEPELYLAFFLMSLSNQLGLILFFLFKVYGVLCVDSTRFESCV
jgi:hypothetical protein